MLRLRQASRRLRAPAGSALTEFVIVLPLFIVLIFWSEFFADFSILTLKAEEAARYALWETTAERSPTTVANEIETRFATLNSPQIYSANGAQPPTPSFKKVNVTVNPMQWGTAALNGSLPAYQPSTAGGSFVTTLLQGINAFESSYTQGLVGHMGFNTTREAQGSVNFRAVNSLFPTGSMFHIFFDSETGMEYPVLNINVARTSPAMLVDTWKAWPGLYAVSNTSDETPVLNTYSAGSGVNAVEQEISARLNPSSPGGGVAFYSGLGLLNSILGFLDLILNVIDLPAPFSTSTWTGGSLTSGPVVALPGAAPLHGWSAGSGSFVQRLGDEGTSSDTAEIAQTDPSSPAVSTNVSRFTVPSRINTEFWTGPGGLDNQKMATSSLQSTANFNQAANNPYITLYGCRDGYYMGGVTPQNPRWLSGTYNPNYFAQANPQCP